MDRFLAAQTGPATDRRPILAIIGGTQTGKSLLAASVLEKLAQLQTQVSGASGSKNRGSGSGRHGGGSGHRRSEQREGPFGAV